MSQVGTVSQVNQQKALRIFAKTVHRELKASGYSRSDIVGFTNELLGLVTTELRDEGGNRAEVA